MRASKSTPRWSSSSSSESESEPHEENNSTGGSLIGARMVMATAVAVVVVAVAWEEEDGDETSMGDAAAIAIVVAGAVIAAWVSSRMLSDNTDTNKRNHHHLTESSLDNTPRWQRSIWSPPPPGRFKLNTDGACRPVPVGYLSQDSVQRGPSGYGGILRDHRGNWVRGFIGFIGDSDCLTSELHGILKGLEVLDKLNLEGSILETDSQAAYEFVTGDDEYRRKKDIVLASWPIIQKCRQLADKNGISFNLVPGRDANQCADKLADMAVKKRAAYEEFTDLPRELRSLVDKDAKVN